MRKQKEPKESPAKDPDDIIGGANNASPDKSKPLNNEENIAGVAPSSKPRPPQPTDNESVSGSAPKSPLQANNYDDDSIFGGNNTSSAKDRPIELDDILIGGSQIPKGKEIPSHDPISDDSIDISGGNNGPRRPPIIGGGDAINLGANKIRPAGAGAPLSDDSMGISGMKPNNSGPKIDVEDFNISGNNGKQPSSPPAPINDDEFISGSTAAAGAATAALNKILDDGAAVGGAQNTKRTNRDPIVDDEIAVGGVHAFARGPLEGSDTVVGGSQKSVSTARGPIVDDAFSVGGSQQTKSIARGPIIDDNFSVGGSGPSKSTTRGSIISDEYSVGGTQNRGARAEPRGPIIDDDYSVDGGQNRGSYQDTRGPILDSNEVIAGSANARTKPHKKAVIEDDTVAVGGINARSTAALAASRGPIIEDDFKVAGVNTRKPGERPRPKPMNDGGAIVGPRPPPANTSEPNARGIETFYETQPSIVWGDAGTLGGRGSKQQQSKPDVPYEMFHAGDDKSFKGGKPGPAVPPEPIKRPYIFSFGSLFKSSAEPQSLSRLAPLIKPTQPEGEGSEAIISGTNSGVTSRSARNSLVASPLIADKRKSSTAAPSPPAAGVPPAEKTSTEP